MLASIIIPTHRRHSHLLNLLDSLTNQDISLRELEVIIVSNLSDPRLKNLLKRKVHPSLSYQYFEVGNLGVNRARNLGLSKAQGKYLFFLDDDCFVSRPQYLKKGIELLERWPEVSAVGGPYTLRAKSNLVEQVYNSICRQWLEDSVRKSGYTVNLVGGNMVFRRSVFAGDLRFNEEIVFGGAETELHARLVQQGYRLRYEPNFTVEHHLHLNLQQFFFKAFWQGFGAARREQAQLSTKTKAKSVFSACPYPSRLTEFYLAFYDHSFQMGQEWAKRVTSRSPRWSEVAALFIIVLKKDLTLTRYKQWLKLKPLH